MSETNLENLDTALAEDGVVVEPTAPAEPQIDAQGRAYATGKRKNAIARVWIKPGSGVITVNGREETKYFARPGIAHDRASAACGCGARRTI